MGGAFRRSSRTSSHERMSAMGRLRPVAILTSDRLLLGESGHRNFDAKPRAYEFANGCLRPQAEVRELHTFYATPILRMTASA